MVLVPRRPTRWSHVRAALLLSALLVGFFQGLPMPQIEAKHIDRPSGRQQLQRWAGRLTELGYPITPDELREKTLETVEEVNAVHAELLAPVMPVFHWTQIRERWSLFAGSDPTPWWIHVEARFHGEEEFRLLWRPMDPEAVVLQPLFEYRRLRGIWNPGGSELRGDHPRFLRFTFNTLFDRFPEIDEVRVRFKRFYVHVPGEPPNDHVEWRWESRDVRAASRVGEIPVSP